MGNVALRQSRVHVEIGRPEYWFTHICTVPTQSTSLDGQGGVFFPNDVTLKLSPACQRKAEYLNTDFWFTISCEAEFWYSVVVRLRFPVSQCWGTLEYLTPGPDTIEGRWLMVSTIPFEVVNVSY